MFRNSLLLFVLCACSMRAQNVSVVTASGNTITLPNGTTITANNATALLGKPIVDAVADGKFLKYDASANGGNGGWVMVTGTSGNPFDQELDAGDNANLRINGLALSATGGTIIIGGTSTATGALSLSGTGVILDASGGASVDTWTRQLIATDGGFRLFWDSEDAFTSVFTSGKKAAIDGNGNAAFAGTVYGFFSGNGSNIDGLDLSSTGPNNGANGGGLAGLTYVNLSGTSGTFGNATQSLTITASNGVIVTITAQTVTPAVGSITGLGAGVATALGNATNASGGLVSVTSGTANNLTLTGTTTIGSGGTALTLLKTGTSQLSSGTVTVVDSAVTTTARVFAQDNTTGSLTNVGVISIVVASGSFTATSTNILDASPFSYLIIK